MKCEYRGSAAIKHEVEGTKVRVYDDDGNILRTNSQELAAIGSS